ncbi:MAG: SdrD B-like domain-containing protein [Chloroflexota bacterium]
MNHNRQHAHPSRPTSLPIITLFITLIMATLTTSKTLFAQQDTLSQNIPAGTSTLGNYVWHDADEDGLQDGPEGTPELGIDGVLVQLYVDNNDGIFDINVDQLSSGVVTGDNPGTPSVEMGWYEFEVDFGTTLYWVYIPPSNFNTGEALSGFQSTASFVGTNVELDSETNPILVIEPNSVANREDIDFGFTQAAPGSIGDRVWNDTNRNGVQDNGEIGIGNVTVELYSASTNGLIDTATTSSNGDYTFDDLVAGSYYIVVTPPAGYVFSPQGAGNDGALDSDVDPNTGQSGSVSVASGEFNQHVDAGLYQPASLGDTVWHDVDGDGVQNAADPLEVGIADVVVTLYDATDTFVMSTTTDGNGNYLFDGLAADTYYVVVTAPTGYTFTQQNQGGNEILDSDVDATGTTANITLTEGENNLDVDAGLYQPASVGDYAWRDVDADGFQDSSENGLSGVVVSLYSAADDSLVMTTTTGLNGDYLFENIAPSDYYIIFTTPSGFQLSAQDQGADTNDSDPNQASGQTDDFTLASGEANTTIDAGYYEPGSISGLVWLDDDANGIADAAESNVSGVTVTLYDATTNTALSTVSTGADGSYAFLNLLPGTYYIAVTKPSGTPSFIFSPQDQGSNDIADSDVNVNSGNTGSVPLTSGTNITDLDAGLYQPPSIGDRVWIDGNGDGIQNSPEGIPENGVSGVTVELYNATNNQLIDFDITDADGMYLFSDLDPGSYYLLFYGLTGYNFSPQSMGGDAGDDSAVDSDADVSTGVTGVYTLLSGMNERGVDAGIFEPATLGDRVWEDSNGNGLQDDDEPGVADILVSLYEASNATLLMTTTTDLQGNYLFEGLSPGDYILEFSQLPTDYLFADADQGSDDSADSDVAIDTGRTTTITLGVGAQDVDWDAGLIPPSNLFSLGDLVWNDMNRNGLQDNNEEGIPDILVALYSDAACDAAAFMELTTTDSNGLYEFDRLEAGTYCVQFSDLGLSDGWQLSPADQTITSGTGNTGSDNIDSDGVAAAIDNTAQVSDIALTQSDQTVDLGLYLPGSIEGVVWCENANNHNSTYDSGDGDSPLGNISVALFADTDCNGTANGDALASLETDGTTGIYHFTDLAVALAGANNPTCYIAQVDPLDTDLASCNQPLAGDELAVALTTAEADQSGFNFGFSTEAVYSLGNRVWGDLDQDGLQDLSEDGLADIQVQLFNDSACAGDVLATTVTDSEGYYLFSGLLEGDYCIEFSEIPTRWLVGVADAGDDDAVDSDGMLVDETNTSHAQIANITLTGDDLTQDLGLYSQVVTIGDYVWWDIDGNGLQDEDEFGVPNVQATLYYADGPLANTATGSVTTNDDGYYQFDDAIPGNYYVIFDLDTLPPGFVVTGQDAAATAGNDLLDSDVDPATGQSAATGYLTSGEEYLSLDMGIYQPVAVGDRVWEDRDADGIQELGEPGVAGIRVSLFTAAGNDTGLTTVTDSDGLYRFENLAPGDYYVVFDLSTVPVGYMPTIPNVGSDDAFDSDAFGPNSSAPGRTDPTPYILSGGEDTSLDMGIVELVSVGDRVWLDSDGDGLQGESELGLPNVEVTLFNANGLPVFVNGRPSTTTTDGNGNYRFDGLPPGSYFVVFNLNSLPDNHVATVSNVGSDDTLDSDANTSNGQTAVTPYLIGGDADLSLDMGVQDLLGVRIGDTVWLDRNGNGVQDAGEPGVPGVSITAHTGQHVPLGVTAVTDDNGNYLFADLPPGSYYIVVDLDTLPTDHFISPMGAGDDEALDSDVDAETGSSTIIPLVFDGEQNLDIDMGIYALSSLGDQVWWDADGDGFQRVDDSGIPDVVVNLYDSEGELVATTTTDDKGNYFFDALMPGQYQLEFISPAGFTFSPMDQGMGEVAETLDSDVDPTTGRTPVFELESGYNNVHMDAGLFEGASVGDFVWHDVDGNGVQDAGEPGIFDVTISVFNSDGTLAAATTSDENGAYNITGLFPGDYIIQFAPPQPDNPDGDGQQALTYTRPNNTTDDNVDSDVDPATGETSTVNLTAGENDVTWDAGFTAPASVGNFVWIDADEDGIKDGDEPGISGMVVNIYGADGQLLDTTVTDAFGFFQFINLTPGEYYLEFLPPVGFFFTEQNQGSSGDFNSDANPLTGLTEPISLEVGQNDVNWGAGLIEAADELQGPTAIELISFSAIITDAAILVTWETGSESDTLGFHLYRSLNGDRGDAVRITSDMVLSQGADGNTYTYLDESIVGPAIGQEDEDMAFVYVYWLREVENGGSTRDYGPVGASETLGQGGSLDTPVEVFLPVVMK